MKAPDNPAQGDERRKLVGIYLRTADRLIKEGKLGEAKRELERVWSIEPHNAYALAFEERITTLEKSGTPEQPKPPAEPGSPGTEAPAPSPAQQQPVRPAPLPLQVPTGPSLDVLRAEIEKKLEEEYKQRFARVVQDAEKRVADTLAREEAKHTAERKEFLDRMEAEKTSYKKTLELEFREKLQDELHRAEERYRSQLEQERRKAEEDVRSQVDQKVKDRSKELQATMEKERTALADKQKQSLDLMKKALEAAHAHQLADELEKIKRSTSAQEVELRVKLEESVRAQLRSEFEVKLAEEHKSIQDKHLALQKDLEEKYRQQNEQVRKEQELLLDQRLKEIRKQESEKFEQKRVELQQTLELDYQRKLQQQLDEERLKLERRTDETLEKERTAHEQERKLLLEEEQTKLEELRQHLKKQMEEDEEKRLTQARDETAQSYEQRLAILGFEIPKTDEEKVRVYQERLRRIWSSGPITMETAQELMQLQEVLGLGFEEHSQCEEAIRLKLYIETIEQGILGGSIKVHDMAAIEALKERYGITPEEASGLEKTLLSLFQRAATRGTIFICDDDSELVDMLKIRLQDEGYDIITANSLATAGEILETTTPDLILCDIQFKGEQGDGFTFFKQSQQKPHLRKIPFILMSGLDEGLFIRTGAQLGIDDYLTKPLDLELLVAVIEGKLKKYKALRNT